MSETTTYNPDTRTATGGTYPVFQSVNTALDNLATGGTLNIRAGTYRELKQTNTAYKISRNCTIQAYNGESVTLTYPVGIPPVYGAGPDYGFVVDVWANAVIDGITFIGMKDEGNQDGGYDVALSITQYGQGTIKNCTFQKAGHAAIKYAATAGDVVIEKCVFENTGHSYLDHHIYIANEHDGTHKTTIRHNTFTDVAGYALHFYGAPDNIEVYGNVIHHCGTPGGAGGGIVLGGTGHKVYNNTICNNYGLGGLLIWGDYSINNAIYNNIIRDNAAKDIGVRMDIIGTNTSGSNNVGVVDNPTSQGYDDSTDVDVDPQFASSPLNSWDDYRLAVGSPMIDAGADVGADYIAILDPAQTTRPTPKNQGASRDIGAFTT